MPINGRETETETETDSESSSSSEKMADTDESSSSFFFPFKILLDSLAIFSRNKRLFLSLFLLFSFPLSLLLFTLSLSSHPLKTHILHLESVVRHAPTRFEYRHVFSESRDDAFSLLRLRAAFFLPIYAFSLLAAVTTVSSTLHSFAGKRPTLKSALNAVKLAWIRPLVTTICIYALLTAYSVLPRTLASMARPPAARFAILGLGLALEVYLVAIAGLGLVVSIAEERFGWDAIRAGSGLMAGRRISGSVLTGLFVGASGTVAWEMEGLMDGVDHWMRKSSAVTATVAVSVGDKVGLILLYGAVILAGYVVTTVFYCECRKKDFTRVENGEDDEHVAMV